MTPKIKILFFIHDLMHGGAEKVLVNLVNHLSQEKYEITVLTLFDVGVNKQFLAPHIHYRGLFKRFFRGNSILLRNIPKRCLYRWAIKGKYDLLVSYLEGSTTRILGGAPANIPKIAWLHVEQTQNNIHRCYFSRRELVQVYSSYRYIASVSQDVQQNFNELCPVHTPGSVIYNVNETGKILSQSRETIENSDFKTELPTLIGVGKIRPAKGFMRLAHIHRCLMEEGVLHRVYLLGIGEEQPAIQTYIDEHGLTGSFHFLGYDTNPYKYVARASAFVCASFSEGFSTAATEALVVGTPVITTNCAGMKEMLGEHDEYGIVTDNDEEALHQGIRRLLTEPGLLDYYRKQAEERGKCFSMENTVAQADQLFSEVLHG